MHNTCCVSRFCVGKICGPLYSKALFQSGRRLSTTLGLWMRSSRRQHLQRVMWNPRTEMVPNLHTCAIRLHSLAKSLLVASQNPRGYEFSASFFPVVSGGAFDCRGKLPPNAVEWRHNQRWPWWWTRTSQKQVMGSECADLTWQKRLWVKYISQFFYRFHLVASKVGHT